MTKHREPSPAAVLAATLDSEPGDHSIGYYAAVDAEALVRLGKRYDPAARRVLASWTDADETAADKAEEKIACRGDYRHALRRGHARLRETGGGAAMKISPDACTARGSGLHPADQAFVLAAYVHRFSGDHTPAWALRPRPDGTAYPLQFASDAEWLANSRFAVRRDGRLDRRVKQCFSSPTWPNNPELRRGAS
ncbi:hypothetical protein [Arvimicrobium flavum]|uniref:hypothetical protein n=1 Tax=Arvimicrobium flavum TaxID=3393320 RepID=UPI00237C1CDE|nr:hypothetical protein [Mesorhizobium shangrilense]